MLVLTRKEYQTITIGDSITITVLRTEGSRTKIGVEAPGNVTIRRGELEPREQPHDPPASE